MSALQYKGRTPNSDFSMVHKKHVDTVYGAGKVDLAYINQAVSYEAMNQVMAIKDYVDYKDGTLAQKTTVDVADNNYLLASELGKPNGLVKLDSDTFVPLSALSGLQTERKAFFKNADTLALTGVNTRVLTQVNPREFEVGRLTIPELGFPYVPLLLAAVTGGSLAGTNATAALGTGNFAQLSILRSDNIKYAYTLTSSQKTYETFSVLPHADADASPAPLSGPNTFSLWAGLDRGTTYTLSAVGLSFFAIALPGL